MLSSLGILLNESEPGNDVHRAMDCEGQQKVDDTRERKQGEPGNKRVADLQGIEERNREAKDKRANDASGQGKTFLARNGRVETRIEHIANGHSSEADKGRVYSSSIAAKEIPIVVGLLLLFGGGGRLFPASQFLSPT